VVVKQSKLESGLMQLKTWHKALLALAGIGGIIIPFSLGHGIYGFVGVLFFIPLFRSRR